MKFLTIAAAFAATALAGEGHDHGDHVDCSTEQATAIKTFLESPPPAACTSVWTAQPTLEQLATYFEKNPASVAKLCANAGCKTYFTSMAALPDCMYMIPKTTIEANFKDGAKEALEGCTSSNSTAPTNGSTITTPAPTAAKSTAPTSAPTPKPSSANALAAISLSAAVATVAAALA
ncbi:hypothetical protein SPRG_04975 [Saprolegnia parasitica CBS 223.65]|uniref:Secreted protein n=1 Tax=Saprolegnia parasitica (strain CBS 223.65) TaxID=695850 RepID=A0A067CGM3_SAPPC|nr:hypothetical protein SPRG_04975 [Saprolegnia parasitica CBS 223.65]KDO29909.1 hypothetical protein SPRG_04975 [Saprolegnia parasitica CBS 223.65]|eukprot:XP_012199503.1 hypothetical protein SPRG_04975 [Saprolegnia parasitica CBS 223.65]